ncbi:MAG: tRNA (adenosine(37)-N6)-threonylcarbamoyltransferase complex ATPase subunit type 1 TsaE [Candidatus Tectomicrobia bacterium]|nr:tRNA (adenosine(37)-N6)-threonylcarbamoyltransferase complex ATPase subunit type 1 TsaE [Candidatus Tectomicrobia bacterium]
MRVWTVRSEGPRETVELGKAVGRRVAAGHVLCITGPLGSGKTVLTRGIVEGVRGDAKGVRSPSFTLVNEYPGPVRVYHVDLYRTDSSQEIAELGLEEVMGSQAGPEAGAVIVEWGEKMGKLAPADRLDIRIKVKGPETREIALLARGPRHEALLGAVCEDPSGD